MLQIKFDVEYTCKAHSSIKNTDPSKCVALSKNWNEEVVREENFENKKMFKIVI